MRAIPKTAKIHPAAKNVVAGKNLPYVGSITQIQKLRQKLENQTKIKVRNLP